MSLLDENFDISNNDINNILIKRRLLDLIKKSDYYYKDCINCDNIKYYEPSKRIKYPERYCLTVTKNDDDNKYHIRWKNYEKYSDLYAFGSHELQLRIHCCMICLDEWNSNEYLYQVYEQ